MNNPATATRSVVVEREFAHPPAKIWRALTQPHLIEAWLMKSDFAALPGHRFSFSAEWGSVACEVTVIDAQRSLAYTWCAMGLESVVTWTLTPSAGGTRLRMEQAGFGPEQEQAYQGAQYGWPAFLTALERVLAREEG
ncbi:SRPBCC domain-containing protein [Massilia atriviolacea]|uniref:SRPBCC domain-containing protein n=1 Tax=Massilia atriviolacea TaxID=2495579 RepID=A0A430HRP6_9BURK|nr:SRPBCC domain-containing protein [Massilia atriviolacea]RSZ60198.1 SRPBCC domain-containing protein [Massilia atriviolacea]